jgi:peroxiredoxin
MARFAVSDFSRRTQILILLLLALFPLSGVTAWYVKKQQEPGMHRGFEEATIALAGMMEETSPEKQSALLATHMDNASPGARLATIEEVWQRPNPDTIPLLEKAFRDSSSAVRQRALETLHAVSPERGRLLLLAGLQDDDLWVRRSAATQMVTMIRNPDKGIDKTLVPALIAALQDKDIVVLSSLSTVLVKLTGKPWRIRGMATHAERRAGAERWQNWWATVQGEWKSAPELATITPIYPERSDPAPPFQLPDVDGKPIRLSDQRGKLTLINFWGTWCPPCVGEVGDLAKLDKQYRSQGLDIIGVALSERQGANGLRTWCLARGITYRQALATPEILHAYGDIHEVPISVLIDKSGRVRYRWEGERDHATFQKAVARLLSEP